MTPTQLTRTRQALPGRDAPSTIRSTLGGRRSLITAGAAIAVAGLAFNWSWLVAAGIAPVLLSLLPCAAMCALGLCMTRMTGGSCPAENVTQKDGAASSKTPSADMKGNG